jgi:hypothetical protein
VPPLSASCSSDQRFAYGFLQIPPRDGHPWRSANTSLCRVCRGLPPPSKRALPCAPNQKPAAVAAGPTESPACPLKKSQLPGTFNPHEEASASLQPSEQASSRLAWRS